MMFQGTNQVAAQYVADNASLADVDYFEYPMLTEANGQDALQKAPIDGFMLSAKGGKNPEAGKKDLLAYFGSPDGPEHLAAVGPPRTSRRTSRPDGSRADDGIQKGAADDRQGRSRSRSFLDRDALPAFASNVMIPSLGSRSSRVRPVRHGQRREASQGRSTPPSKGHRHDRHAIRRGAAEHDRHRAAPDGDGRYRHHRSAKIAPAAPPRQAETRSSSPSWSPSRR